MESGSGMPMSQADAGPQKEWPSNGPLVSACNKAPAPEPDAAPEPAEAGRLASAHASRSNSQDWGCSPHPSPTSTDRWEPMLEVLVSELQRQGGFASGKCSMRSGPWDSMSLARIAC